MKTRDTYFDPLLDRIAENANEPSRKLINSLKGYGPLGKGAEKIVYDLGNNKVVALFMAPPRYYNLEYLKRRYQSQKLLHLVLPNNIPDVHLVGSKPAMLISEKIERGPDIDHETYYDESKELMTRLEAIGVKAVDFTIGNFVRDVNGNMQYVDSIFFEPHPLGLAKAINELKEPQAKQARYYARKADVSLSEDLSP